jgi:hypothetical protein
MICFDVYINGERICRAGVDADHGVLSSILTWVRRDLDQFPPETRDRVDREELSLNVAGHISLGDRDFEHLEWVKRPLSPGDDVSIRILDTAPADEPARVRRSGPGSVPRQGRKRLEVVKPRRKPS